MNKQPQACIHESTEHRVVPACCESLPCGPRLPMENPTTTVLYSTARQRGALRTVVSVCAASPRHVHQLITQLCIPGKEPTHKHPNPGQWANTMALPSPCVHVQTVETLVHWNDSAHLPAYTFGCWKPRIEMTVQNKN